MNQTSKKQDFRLRPGDVVTGKWHHKKYVIRKRLGSGAIGSVYLCESDGKPQALKISDKSSSITMEVNVLKSFQKVQGNRLGPSLLDVDDWIDPRGERYSFYVMEFLRGKQLSTFIHAHGEEWLGILMLQLLDDLTELHEAGWVFGDLKTDNLIVTYPPPRLRWIDVGGTTQIGRSIKEFTEFYDRGYWNFGSRKAEPSYDLFALAMVMLHFYHPKRFERGSNPQKTLLQKLYQTKPLAPYQPCLAKALKGEYTTSKQMKDELASLIMKRSDKGSNYYRINQRNSNTQPQPRRRSQVNKQTKAAGHPFLESIGIFIVVILFYLFYLILK
ncbi:protein kinase domain-containing protein [Aquibacillus salsiterrae]|uniref:Protein kinase family protein n=1 Tax=Aquibacillus salsiterrae TaxID=2950439 RepID=A0A9X3WI73_9BACI|nr:protein kinase family protein [Aquibacillus salsiterrae]MDC3417914.1 protein kinase family protein [Aquibacillus salsiterrae]